jgi:radical SAM protein with 4Fe4S-binding SPASM domain
MERPFQRTLDIQRLPLWDKLREKRAPLSFNLEITARCNNDCGHCYINLPAGDKKAEAEELSAAEILSIADRAVEMGAVWCLITGGEPLLRPDFPEIFMGLKGKGLLVGVFTNATLIREEHVRLFKQYPPRSLEVTVYGVREETYEAVTRRAGSFAAFQRGLQLLLENRTPVRLKAVAMRSNFRELPEIAEFCRVRGDGSFRFDPFLHLRYDGDPRRNAEIRAERLTPEEIVELERSDPERLLEMEKQCDKLIQPEARPVDCDHLFHCGCGQGEFTVGYNGLFRLCGALWAPGTTYDLRAGSLRAAWSELGPKVREMRSRNTLFLKTCLVCPIINLCLFCPAHAHLETGAMDGETRYFCAVAHARAGIAEKRQ